MSFIHKVHIYYTSLLREQISKNEESFRWLVNLTPHKSCLMSISSQIEPNMRKLEKTHKFSKFQFSEFSKFFWVVQVFLSFPMFDSIWSCLGLISPHVKLYFAYCVDGIPKSLGKKLMRQFYDSPKTFFLMVFLCQFTGFGIAFCNLNDFPQP